MTSQVILLNNMAIALASDSTITTQDRSSRQRTANSSEKIFAVGGDHNLAVLSNGNADIGVFPVDALLTEWERTLKSTLSTVDDYITSFIQWLRNSDAFKHEDMENQLVIDMIDEIIRPAYLAIKKVCEPLDLGFESDAGAVSDEIFECILEQISYLGDWNYYDLASDKWVSKTIIDLKDSITDRITWWLDDVPNLPNLDAAVWDLVRIGLGRKTGMSPAGIVFVGFGDSQLLPAYSYLDIFGVARGVVFYRENQKYEHKSQQGWYRFLAQTEAQRTFLDGVSNELSGATNEFMLTNMAELKLQLNEVIDEQDPKKWVTTFEEHSTTLTEKYFDLIRSSRTTNDEKLQDVIRLAPESDLALLASMFVSIEAFSELISSPQPTVGGPIDVAVMNKRHGFRWVRHKNLEGGSNKLF